MEELKSLLEQRALPIKKEEKQRKRNPIWDSAKEFGDYIGLPTPFILKLFKIYGQSEVLKTRSFLKDYPTDGQGLHGLIIWKLKENQKV